MANNIILPNYIVYCAITDTSYSQLNSQNKSAILYTYWASAVILRPHIV
jgi:hypothetical protein